MKPASLGPDSCGWHYVDGLTDTDDPQIAILWDKVGLGHNGERIKGGGHEVGYLDGSHRVIRASKWPEFLGNKSSSLRNVPGIATM